MNALRRWVELWDAREPPHALALVRIAVGLVLAWDLTTVARLGLVTALWAPIEQGGIGPTTLAAPHNQIYTWFGASATNAWWLYGVACACAFSLCAGLFTRTSALLLALSSAQLAMVGPDADRGIDTLLRNALWLLACSAAGGTWSLDALLRRGRWSDDTPAPAWPRYLLILQLALLYCGAGWAKQAASWTSLDGYSALYITLNHPHYATFTPSRQLLQLAYPLLQLATCVTVWFERLAPLMPVLLWLRATAQRGGRVRSLVNRARLLELWVGLGVTFHLGLAVVLDLGMFPWGCLALYPAMASPHGVRAWLTRARRLASPRSLPEPTASEQAIPQ